MKSRRLRAGRRSRLHQLSAMHPGPRIGRMSNAAENEPMPRINRQLGIGDPDSLGKIRGVRAPRIFPAP